MTARQPSEHDEQVMVCRYLDANQVPYFAVPNGVLYGVKNRHALAAKLKREGMQPGAPDLVLLRQVKCAPWSRYDAVRAEHDVQSFAPVALEMKARNGQLSKAQREFHPVMRAEGWIVLIAKGAKDAISQLAALGIGDGLAG